MSSRISVSQPFEEKFSWLPIGNFGVIQEITRDCGFWYLGVWVLLRLFSLDSKTEAQADQEGEENENFCLHKMVEIIIN